MILYGKEAQEKLLAGVNLVADTVKYTLGPKAKTVVLGNRNGPPIIINDGVTIAKAVASDDEFIQMGVELLQNVASQAQENAGDGTTTASVLTQAILLGWQEKYLDYDSVKLKQELDEALKLVVAQLEQEAKPITSREDLEYVATIAANNDSVLGKLISYIMEQIGYDGIISVKRGEELKTTWETNAGLSIDSGFMHFSMINDKEKANCSMENALVLMCNHAITNFKDLIPAVELSLKEGRPLLIMAKQIEGNAYPNLLMNIVQKTFNGCAVKAPDFGDDQIEILRDIRAVIGGKVFVDELGDDISSVTLEDLGSVKSIKVDRTNTVFVTDGKTNIGLDSRCEELRQLIPAAKNAWLEEKLQARLGKLTGGVAVIKVGGATEIEVTERMERLDDALNATKAAIQGGVILGGGLELYKCTDSILSGGKLERSNGLFLLLDAIKEPMYQIGANAGHTVDKLRLVDNVGFDANTEEYTDLLSAGVIDPVKVVKSSLRTAVSVAGLIITTEVLVGKPSEELI
jgi:chaperonin GroEL